jgi:inorganic pyrophosphatase
MVEHYYSHYKDWKRDWQGSEVSFNGWGDASEAKQVINESIQRHQA